jgi:hypothetical protein
MDCFLTARATVLETLPLFSLEIVHRICLRIRRTSLFCLAGLHSLIPYKPDIFVDAALRTSNLSEVLVLKFDYLPAADVKNPLGCDASETERSMIHFKGRCSLSFQSRSIILASQQQAAI